MVKKILGISLIVAITFLTFMGLPLKADANWSSWETTSLKSSDGWKRTGAYSGKAKSQASWSAEASDKTMWSNPQKRLINSENKVRGKSITLKKTDQIYTADTENAFVGYNYYAQIKPAFNQIGTDSITSRHKAD